MVPFSGVEECVKHTAYQEAGERGGSEKV